MNNFNYQVRRMCFLITLLFTLATINAYAQFVYCPLGQGAFDECEPIDCIVCNLDGYSGSTTGYGDDPDGDLAGVFCGTVESVQYIRFYAAVTQLSITVSVSNCNVNAGGIDLAAMAVCDQALLACIAGNGTGNTTLNLSNLIVGQTYILIIDVDAASDCDLDINVSPADGTINPSTQIPPNPVPTITGDLAVCPNATAVYQVEGLDPNHYYSWTAPANALINGAHSPVIGSGTVTVTWGNTGGILCVSTNQCLRICQNVTMAPIPTTIVPPIKVCYEDKPYVLPWGDQVSINGTYSAMLSSYQGCDSAVTQTVSFLPQNIQTLPPIKLCADACVSICGESYCDNGFHTVVCESASGCDSVINFLIIRPNFVADILGSGIITCAHPTITLNSADSPGDKTWHNAAGQALGTGNTLMVNSPGTYYLSVAMMWGTAICTLVDSVIVLANTTPPVVTASGAMVGCDTVPALLHAVSLVNPANYTWSGPNGFSSGLQNPVVTDLGAYIVTVIDTLNGCSAKDTAYVTLCCAAFAGTFDSTLLSICGEKNAMATFHNDQNLGPNDSLVFILYTNPADPLGSILMMMGSPVFPFIAGLMFHDSTYYIASLDGPVLPDSTIDLHSACLSLSAAEPVMWVPKPTISLDTAPNEVCNGLCMDITFQFTGIPPFQFHYNVSQNGQPLLSQDETSDTLQKTITVCPAMFSQAPAPGAIDFNVNFLQDLRCGCND